MSDGQGQETSAGEGPSELAHPRDAVWRRKPAVDLFLTTFAILVLELALIRWLGTQIRIAAYFANLVLVSAFLGMGLGVGLGRSRPHLARWALPALALVSAVMNRTTVERSNS